MQLIGRHFILLLFLMGKKKRFLPNLWTYAQIVICQVNNQLAAIQKLSGSFVFLFCGRIDGWSIRRLFCVCPLTIALTRWSLGGCQLVTPRSISGWKFEKKQNISPLIIFRPSKYDERRLCIVIFRLLTIVFTLSTVFSLCTKNVNETKRKSYQNEGDVE